MNEDLFLAFLESFRSDHNKLVMETVMQGYHNVFGGKTGNGAINQYFADYNETPEEESLSSAVNYTPNADNQYFNQTLPSNEINEVNASQSGVRGGRTMTYPPAGKTSDSLQNPMTRRTLGVQNSNDAPSGSGPTIGGAGTTGLGYATGAGGA